MSTTRPLNKEELRLVAKLATGLLTFRQVSLLKALKDHGYFAQLSMGDLIDPDILQLIHFELLRTYTAIGGMTMVTLTDKAKEILNNLGDDNGTSKRTVG